MAAEERRGRMCAKSGNAPNGQESDESRSDLRMGKKTTRGATAAGMAHVTLLGVETPGTLTRPVAVKPVAGLSPDRTRGDTSC
jgi:hypothetical protein